MEDMRCINEVNKSVLAPSLHLQYTRVQSLVCDLHFIDLTYTFHCRRDLPGPLCSLIILRLSRSYHHHDPNQQNAFDHQHSIALLRICQPTDNPKSAYNQRARSQIILAALLVSTHQI
jgi:hypothetical protein